MKVPGKPISPTPRLADGVGACDAVARQHTRLDHRVPSMIRELCAYGTAFTLFALIGFQAATELLWCVPMNRARSTTVAGGMP